MATINYSIRGKSNPSTVYCRFSHGRGLDIFAKTNVLINPGEWDVKRQIIKNSSKTKNFNLINRKLGELKLRLIDDFNEAFVTGDIIDKVWLDRSISAFLKRPKDEIKVKNKETRVYYVDFAKLWLNEKAKKWMVSADGVMNDRTISQYLSFLELFIAFQGKNRYRIKEVNHDVVVSFVDFLVKNSYAEKTISRHLGRIRFFCTRAEEEGIEIDKSNGQRCFIPRAKIVLEPTLNIKEIERLSSLNLSKNQVLDNARDNLIIACWTGLRVSDFLNQLNISNFIDDFIEIQTTKTKTSVVIPVHPMVKKILIKRNGHLPKKVNDADFNKQVKQVCRIAKIEEVIEGRLFNSAKKRKVLGFYKKYELVSSHIGRRSFATNHYGKIPDDVIQKIGGWASKEMMLKYIKKSNREHAIELKKYWDKSNYELI